jgi:O-antigen/teichoic acid export membrane protein
LFPVWLFVISALPKLSYMFEHDREECLQTLRTYQHWTVIYALISTPLIILSAPWIIYVFSGEFNDQAAMYFRLLCIETFVLTINIFLIHYFPIAGKFGVFAKIYGFTCLITLGLFFVLSQEFGVLGLIWGIIASSLLLLMLTLYFRKKEIMASL